MTAKEIYEIIDLNELPKEKADKLRELEVKTNGFSIQNDRVDETMRNLYAQLKEKKPSALKDLKVEIKKVETKKGDDVIIKETEEIVGKKKVTQKNPTPSSSKKQTITEVAKKIRKEGEEWRQALKRAGEEMRKRDDEASKQVKTELQKLIDFVKNDPNFKDFPRTYGKGRKDIDLLKDASEKALAPGRRVSKKGHMNQFGASKGGRKYTENRDNRSDREASKFPKNIFLAKGGRVHRAEIMEEGGEVFVPVQILANNPDALVNTTTMTELFAEGGMAPTRKLFEDGGAINQGNTDAEYITYGEVLKSGGKLKYDPARDVQAIVIQDGPFKLMFIKGDFLGGAYRLANGGLSEDYNYVSPRKVIFARLKSGEDIKPSNGFWIKKNATGTFYTGKEKAKPAFVKSKKFPLPKKITLSYPYKENEKIMKLLGEFSGKDDFRPAMTFVSIKDGELVSTNAHYLIRLMDPTTKGENELVCESKSCHNIKKTDLKYPIVDIVIQSFQADFSEQYDFVDLYESLMQARENAYEKLQRRSKNTYVVTNIEFKNNDIKFDSGLLLQALKGAISLGMQTGFISYSEARSRAIVITPSEVATGPKYKGEPRALAGKDLILLMPIMGSGYEFESTIVAKQVMADGGEVFVPVQIDANNPDALVNTTTMSELFADGGILKGRNNETGESFGVVIGSAKEYDEGFGLVVRKSYGARIQSFKFRFDENGNLKEILDYGFSLDGIAPDTKGDSGSGRSIFDSNKSTSLKEMGKLTSPAFAKKLYDFVQEQMLGETGMMAKGGYVDLQANLMKELQKLQRDLNSPRLSQYTEGDNSQEEIARQRERASKLARFNEILDLLRELESKKMADGGSIGFEKGGFVAMYGGKKINIEADSLYAAKLKAIEEFKVPKSKQGLLSVVSNKSMANQDFRFMADGGKLEILQAETFNTIVSDVRQKTELSRAEIYSLIEDFETRIALADNKSKSKFTKGGYVAVSEKDGYWYIMSQPTSKEEAQQMIEMGVPRGEMGKVVTLEEAKEYNKVIGREYLEKGGEVSVYNLRKGDKVKTRKGDIETILRKTGSGSYETLENDYSHSPESLEFISRPSRKMADGGFIGSYKKPLKASDVPKFLNLTKNDGHKYSLWNKEVGITYAYNGKLYANDGQVLPKGRVLDLDEVMDFWKNNDVDTLMLEDKELVILPQKQDKYNCFTTGYDGMKNRYGNEDDLTLQEAVEFCWYFSDVKKKYETKEDLEKEISSTPYGKNNVIASQGNISGVVVYKFPTQQYAKGGAMEHMIMEGDSVKAVYKNMLVIESRYGDIYIVDLDVEPFASRIVVEEITGKNSVESAKAEIDSMVARQPSKMAKGGNVFYEGQSVMFPTLKNTRVLKSTEKLFNQYANKELVIGKIESGKPYDNAEAFVKSTGEKVPFTFVLNPKYIFPYNDSGMMAKGGKIREWDDVLVISKNKLGMVEAIGDNIYYVTTPFGETIEATMDDLQKIVSFKEGGDVKIGEIAMIAKENKATGDEVVKKISAGADVEMEHTEDRKVAMRIASDHLKEDFNYYEKLRKAGL